MFRNTLMSLGLAIVALSTLTASGAEAKRHRRPTAESAAPAPIIEWPPLPKCADGSDVPILQEDRVRRLRTYGECPTKNAPKVGTYRHVASGPVTVIDETTVQVECHVLKLHIVPRGNYNSFHCGGSDTGVPGFESIIGAVESNGAAPAPSTATTKTFDKNGYYEIAMGTSDFVIIRYSGPIKAASMDDVKPVRARRHANKK